MSIYLVSTAVLSKSHPDRQTAHVHRCTVGQSVDQT
eukprot:COSAG01_NODE_42369_length_440_cov_10.111437_1_plen_35_part_10